MTAENSRRQDLLARMGRRLLDAASGGPKDYAPNERERSEAMHQRLERERIARGIVEQRGTFELTDNQGREWKVGLSMVVGSYWYNLRRRDLGVATGWLKETKPDIDIAEHLHINPASADYLDNTRSGELTPTEEYDGAERVMQSLFPDFVPFGAVSPQAPAATTEPISG